MEVSGQLQGPAALPPGNSPGWPFNRRLDWPPGRSGQFRRRVRRNSGAIPLLPLYAFVVFFNGSTAPVDLGLLDVKASRSHSGRHSTLGRTPLDEWSARRRDLYLTTHNIHNRQTSMPPAGFEPTTQRTSGRKPTPQTARPPGSASWRIDRANLNLFIWTVLYQ